MRERKKRPPTDDKDDSEALNFNFTIVITEAAEKQKEARKMKLQGQN